MRIAQAGTHEIKDLWSKVEPEVRAATTFEAAAQALSRGTYEYFQPSVVLARVFMTLPYGKLPDSVGQWALKLETGAGVADQLKPTSPILTLMGTYGDREEWRDRRQSRGHVGIPLVSSQFVSGIPMIVRLLRELGVPLEWFDEGDSDIVTSTMGDLGGLFHVHDAHTATDNEGRKIIAAQDFVQAHDIRTVFGIGGAYFGGKIMTLIVFCRDDAARERAERFVPLANYFKSLTTSLATPRHAFASD